MPATLKSDAAPRRDRPAAGGDRLAADRRGADPAAAAARRAGLPDPPDDLVQRRGLGRQPGLGADHGHRDHPRRPDGAPAPRSLRLGPRRRGRQRAGCGRPAAAPDGRRARRPLPRLDRPRPPDAPADARGAVLGRGPSSSARSPRRGDRSVSDSPRPRSIEAAGSTRRQQVGESITVTDNRTGASIEIPIEFGGVSAAEFAKLLPGIWFYDPGFTTTAACESAITFVDGDVGILRYRGLPDRAARRALVVPRGRVPAAVRRAADRRAVRRVAARDHVPHVHPRERAQALPGRVPLRRAPDGHARLGGRRAVHLLRRREGHLRPRGAQPPGRAADREDADAGRGRAPLQRRDALRLPRQRAQLHRELPVDDVEGRRAALPGGPRAVARARGALHPARRPRAELRDDRDAPRRELARRPVLGDRGGDGRPLRPAARRRERGRGQDAHRDRLDRRGARVRRAGQARARARCGASGTASTRATTRARRS